MESNRFVCMETDGDHAWSSIERKIRMGLAFSFLVRWL